MNDPQVTVTLSIDVGFGEPAHVSVSAHPYEIKDAVLKAREAAIYGLLGKIQVDKNKAKYAAKKLEEAKAELDEKVRYATADEVEFITERYLRDYGMYVDGNLHVTGEVTCENNVTTFTSGPHNTLKCCINR
jgi:hypothetical protein